MKALKRHETLAALTQCGIMPIVRVGDSELALDISEALLAGGLNTVEITMTVPGALDVLTELHQRHPDLLLGAGTVLDETMATLAIRSGADYIVSVATLRPVIATAHRYGKAVIPGVGTATEALQATEWGANALKLFPAAQLGPSYLKALQGPLPGLLWCPTGGVTLENMTDWVQAGAGLVGVGSPLLGDVAKTGDFTTLRQNAMAYRSRWEELRG